MGASSWIRNHKLLFKRALELLVADADKIARLIRVQMDHLTMPQCPLYEEVLDTQMFGLSREIDFAVKLGLIEREKAKKFSIHSRRNFLYYTTRIQTNKKKNSNASLRFEFFTRTRFSNETILKTLCTKF